MNEVSSASEIRLRGQSLDAASHLPSIQAVTERPLFSSVDGCGRFGVHVKPRASKTKVLGEKNGAVEVAVAAPPVDGAANEELLRGLALHFCVAKSSVRLVKGDSSRTKLIEIVGLSEAVFLKAIERKS